MKELNQFELERVSGGDYPTVGEYIGKVIGAGFRIQLEQRRGWQDGLLQGLSEGW